MRSLRRNTGVTDARWLVIPAILLIAGCERVERSSSDSGRPPEIVTTEGGIEMVRIPAGRFKMGSDRGPADQSPVHEVHVDEFLIDRYETTQKHYIRLVLADGSKFKGDDRPAEMVSWVNAAMYCNERSADEGLQPCYNDDGSCDFQADGYRLPTEAEWEYACRAGSDADYAFGDDPRLLQEHAWLKDNGLKETHPVGTKKPNRWGLYDMHGNVAEWCNDIYDKTAYESSPESNPRGAAEGDKCVLRGGSWASSKEACKSAHRAADTLGFTDACFPRETIGFRCVRKVPRDASDQTDQTHSQSGE